MVNKKIPTVARAQGMYLYDTDGKEYLDCAAGIAVVNIGHNVPEVIDALAEQSKAVSFVYGGTFTSEARERLAQRIIDMSPEGMSRVFFCSGGSEAIESVIKIARQYHIERGRPQKYKVISRWQSYHGNTIATLSVGGRPSWRQRYSPYLLDVPHIPACNCFRCPYHLDYPTCNIVCACELERVVKYEDPSTVSAFLLEPVIGTTSAATAPPKEYLPIIREICDRYDILLCADEVITGFGRTGLNFAVDHYGVKPDLVGIAKGMASGYMSAGGVIVHQKVVEAVENGSGELGHSFTYSGNPLMCAVSDAVLKYLVENKLVERSAKMGQYFLNKLKTLEELPWVGQARGIGLLLGVEFVADKASLAPMENKTQFASRVAKYCFENGVMITSGVPGCVDGIVGESVQIAPPFIIEEKHVDIVVETLREGITIIGKQL
ncbi:MAG: aspartate aminotransferase family protein [Synergistaceae bacterium]|jgi:adenosylmethionine-8-amino-7-oxononanoate aminotransferase|nr:aspartate aminotransferase family protein [Synergistaceae bacterium]